MTRGGGGQGNFVSIFTSLGVFRPKNGGKTVVYLNGRKNHLRGVHFRLGGGVRPKMPIWTKSIIMDFFLLTSPLIGDYKLILLTTCCYISVWYGADLLKLPQQPGPELFFKCLEPKSLVTRYLIFNIITSCRAS